MSLQNRFLKSAIIGLLIINYSCNQSNTTKNKTDAVVDTLAAGNAAKDAAKAVDPNALISPGKSIGLTSIGEPTDSVIAKLGRPDEGDAAMGKSLSTWFSKSNKAYKTQIFSVIDFGKDGDKQKVKFIKVNNPFFQTSQHIGPGSLFTAAQQFYNPSKYIGYYLKQKDTVKVYNDNANGISFEVNTSGLIEGIMIHAPGMKDLVPYLPFEQSFSGATH